jgi:O-antigen/teichoic acid export membrane protein
MRKKPPARPTGRPVILTSAQQSVNAVLGAATAAYRSPAGLKLRDQLADPLFRNAYALMVNTGTTGVLGVAYWLLAARLYPVTSVGRASAAYAAMSLLAGFTAFNFTGALARFIPQAAHATRALVMVAYLVSTVASVLVTVPFLLLVRHHGGSYAELSSLAAGLAFAVSVVAWSLFTMQDGVLVGMRSAVWVPVENVAFGIVKILLLVALAAALPGTGIYISWVLPAIAAVPLVNFLIFSKLVPRHTALTGARVPPTARQISRFVAGDYTGSLCVLITGNLVPVIVAIRVNPGLTAYFYIAWMIAGTIGLLAINMGTCLTVEGAFDSASLAANSRAALHRMGLILVPVVAAVALLSFWALSLFGPGYAANGTRILQLLAISTVPMAVTEVYLGALRAQSRAALIAFIQISRCVLILGLTLTLIEVMGITGAGWAALVSQVIVAAAILPGLRRVLTNAPPAPAVGKASLPDHRVPASPACGDIASSSPRMAALQADGLDETETASRSDKDQATTGQRISVVICAYSEERWKQIWAAVDSVRAQSLRSDQIIVVVDHNPALWARLAIALPDLLVTDNQEAPGLSGARNTGIALSCGEIIAFLDDDAVAEPCWLNFLCDSYLDPAVVGVGGPAKPRWETRRPPWFPDEFDWVVGCAYRGTPRSRIPVRNLMGANMSFRREILETGRGFRGGLGRSAGKRPLSCEETELCIRIGQAWPASIFIFDDRAVVHHTVPSARCRFSYFRSRCFAEGLSKARVTDMVGAADGLSVERGYVRSVLPRGVARGLADALHGDLWGLCRAGAIIAGLAATAAGYAAGRLRGNREPESAKIPSPLTSGQETAVPDTRPGNAAAGYEPLLQKAHASDVLDLLSGFMTAVLLVASYAGWTGAARTLLVLVFAFFVPGRAIVTNWPGMPSSAKFGMSIALSLGLLTLLATMSLWMHAWHPLTLFQLEAWLSLCGLSAGIIRRRVNWLVLPEKERQ